MTQFGEQSWWSCSLLSDGVYRLKWSWHTRTFAALAGLFSSRIVSMLVKSTCKRSKGAVVTIGCRGALDKLPSCCKQCVQHLIECHIWLVMPGHQKCSHNRDRVWSHPWSPTSQWHPFKVETQWGLGTTKSRRSSVSPLGIECRYKAPWWMIRFCWFLKISLPSSLEACSARSAFKSVFFCAFSQSNTALNIGSSLWASAQSVTCICTSGDHPQLWQVMNFCPMCCSQSNSIYDWSHCVGGQSSSNLAKCIWQCVITPFLIFQFKVELHKGSDPSMIHSI